MSKSGNGERINKPAVRSDFIQGMMTLQQIADKHGLSLGTVHRWSKEERWDRLRTQYQMKEYKRMVEEIMRLRRDNLLEFNKKADEVLNKILNFVEINIERVMREGYLVYRKDGATDESSAEVGRLMVILDMAMRRKYEIYGVKTLTESDEYGKSQNLEQIPDLMRKPRQLPEWVDSKEENEHNEKAAALVDLINEVERRANEL